MVSAVRSLRRFLLSPSTFFDERPPGETLPIAAGLVVLFALCLVGTVLALGSMLAGAVDETVTMDNPNRPPEHVCEMETQLETANCDAPATIERDAGELVWEAVTDYLWIAAVTPFVLWLVAGAVLFAAGRLAGGDPSGRGALSLAGWATVPEFVRFAVVLVGFRIALGDVTITDLDRAPSVVESALAPIEPVFALATLGTACWQWYLLAAGLSRDADLSRAAAAVAVGVPLVTFTLLSLV